MCASVYESVSVNACTYPQDNAANQLVLRATLETRGTIQQNEDINCCI